MLAFQHIKEGCSWESPSPIMSGAVAAIVTAGCTVLVFDMVGFYIWSGHAIIKFIRIDGRLNI